MSDNPCDFDQTLISGYLDGELTQGDRQRVELHLEQCPSCRRIADDLTMMQEATMSTTFPVPADTQWDERPRSGASRVLQYLGFGLAAIWLVALAAALIWQAATEAESVRFEALLGLAPVAAVGLIVASALIDRLKIRATDPYRKVQK
ncbi:MAG: anti-sigma factor [Actinomycetota bacterium]